MFVGVGLLAGQLAFIKWVLAELVPSTQLILAGIVLIIVLLVFEFRYPGTSRLAGNFNVPNSWVSQSDPGRVSFLWGVILGQGWITEAPYRVFQVMVVLLVVSPVPTWAFVVPILSFGVARASIGIGARSRSWVIRRAEMASSWRAAARASVAGVAIGLAACSLTLWL